MNRRQQRLLKELARLLLQAPPRKKSQRSRAPAKRRTSARRRHNNNRPPCGRRQTKPEYEICYHGTSREAAADIVRHGWKVGDHGTLGSGVYFATSQSTASSYASGAIIKVRVSWGKTADFTSARVQAAFQAWSRTHNSQDVTSWALAKGYSGIKNNHCGVLVARPQRNVRWSHFRTPRVRIIGVYDSTTGRPIRV